MSVSEPNCLFMRLTRCFCVYLIELEPKVAPNCGWETTMPRLELSYAAATCFVVVLAVVVE